MRNIISSVRFMLLWVVSSVFSLFTILIVSVILVAIFGVIGGILWVARQHTPTLMEVIIFNTILYTIIGIVMGLLLGVSQQYLIRLKSGEAFRGWVLASTIGSVIGANATFYVLAHQIAEFSFTNLPPKEMLIFYAFELVLIPLLCLSFVQMLVLWQYVRGVWTWVVAHLVGGLVLVSLVAAGLTHITNIAVASTLYGTLLLLFVSAVPGIITGFTMLWLLLFNAHVRE